MGPDNAENTERFASAARGLSELNALPKGRVDAIAPVQHLFELADELAVKSELESTVDEFLAEATDHSVAVKVALGLAIMRSDDRLILDPGIDEMRMMRVDFTGDAVDVPEMDVALHSTPKGALLIKSTAGDEADKVQFAGSFQIFVPGGTEARDGLERLLERLGTTRERELWGLQGSQVDYFGLGIGLRAAWGSGMGLLTTKRLVVMLFDANMSGRPELLEDGWMPDFAIGSDASSVLMLDIPRSAVTEVEVLDRGLVMNRLPYANVHTENATLSVDTMRIVENGLLVRPKKHVLGAALRSIPRT